MSRRAFIAGFAGVAAWPTLTTALDAASPVIGFLTGGQSYKTPVMQPYWAAFQHGLASLGYVEGQNLKIELREGDGHYEQLPDLASDLVRLQPAVLVASQLPAALALKAATTTIPIVFSASDDPVKSELVASLHSPGGNATGINPMMVAPEGKRLELLHELVPDASRIGVLFNPNSPDAASHLADIETAGQSLGLNVVIIQVADETILKNAFAWMNEQQIRAVLVAADPLIAIDHVIRLANQFKIAALSFVRSHTVLGALISYGPSLTDAYRQLGVYTARVLKGEKPSDMPVWQTVRFELVINLKAAKTIGLTIPPTLLARADEVIE